MKKFLLASAAFGLMMGLNSCKLENDDSSNYQSIPYNAINLVIPQNGTPMAAPDNYTLVYYPYSASMSVSSKALSLGVGTSPFTTSQMPYTVAAFTDRYGQGYYEVTKFSGASGNFNGTAISNLSGYTSQLVNLLPSTVPNFPAYPYIARAALVMHYTANTDYDVYTFAQDAVYYGNTTVVSLSEEDLPFVNDETLYRVVFHNDLKQADILFCNAKFNEMMPSNRINFLVKNLDVTFTKTGYTITMPKDIQEIIPDYYEGGQFTPYPMYRFTTFNFATGIGSNLTEAQINFNLNAMGGDQIRARYNCTFSGSYVTSGRDSE